MTIKKSPLRSSMTEDMSASIDQFPEFGARPRVTPRGTSRPSLTVWIIAVIIGIAVGGGFWAFKQGWLTTSTAGVQAIFLENGQVYFGKIVSESSSEVKLTDVYYIQVQDQVQPATTEGGQPTTISVPTLTKRGAELHKPFGVLRLNRQHIVAIENVGADSQVAQQMEALKK